MVLTPPPTAPAATSTAWRTYSSKTVHITVQYPPGWSLGPNTPISMDNFNHQYEGGSIIPMGGAEIDVVSTHYSGKLGDLIKTQTMGDAIGATSAVAAGGVSCTEVVYSASYAPGYPSSNVAVYCPDAANGLLYEIFLSYRAGDAKSSQNLATLAQFLARVQFGAQ